MSIVHKGYAEANNKFLKFQMPKNLLYISYTYMLVVYMDIL